MNKTKFNLVWWVFLAIAGALYSIIPFPFDAKLQGIRPVYIWFLVVYGPFFVVEAIIHWLLLNHFFPETRFSNLILAYFIMPVLLIISIIIFILFIFVYSATKFG